MSQSLGSTGGAVRARHSSILGYNAGMPQIRFGRRALFPVLTLVLLGQPQPFAGAHSSATGQSFV